MLALPVLQLGLGQSDTSALPKSTTVRQAYDTITEGSGRATNGPLLIAVKLDSREADPEQINEVDQQQHSSTSRSPSRAAPEAQACQQHAAAGSSAAAGVAVGSARLTSSEPKAPA